MGIVETMQKLVETYEGQLGVCEVSKVEIGYVGNSNQKFKVLTDDDLKMA